MHGLSFEVQRGTFGIIGPSGGGKTTTMRMLLGVLRPTSGDLRVLGREPHRFRRRERERLGYMPQQFVLFPELSVLENMGFAASIYGMGFFGRAGASAAPWSWSSSGTRGTGRLACSAAACSVAWSSPRRWCTTRR